MSSRALKNKLRNLLSQPNQTEAHHRALEMPLQQVVSPLFSFLYSGDDIIKWHAVTLLGLVVDEIANTNLEAARVVMRRLMWNLNDESGGIGWGSPEAMGEIMARNDALAREYSSILISYIRKDGNYLEHEMLQRGVLWGIGRLSHVQPVLMKKPIPSLIPYITAKDPNIRGLTVWIAAALPSAQLARHIEKLKEDETVIRLYLNEQLTECPISRLAKSALSVYVRKNC
jgi:hypothetical protein